MSLLAGTVHAQSCEDYFQTALRLAAELQHPAEFRVRMGTVSRGKLRDEQLFGAGGIARSEKRDTLEAAANFQWVTQRVKTGQNAPAFQAVRREQVRLTFAREGERVVIRIAGGRKPILLEPRCTDGLVYAEERTSGAIGTWVFHLPFPVCCFTAGDDPARRAVLTQHNDIARTGAYLQETQLTPQAVRSPLRPSRFGLLASFDVDGQIYAQPLYVPNVRIADGTYHNLLYVATSTNHA